MSFDSKSISDDSACETISPFSIIPAIVSTINYATWQNAVPVLKSIIIKNNSTTTLHNIKLELTVTPAFCRSKVWQIDRIVAGDTLKISDRIVELDANYLSALNEAERGNVKLKLLDGENCLLEGNHETRILARDEWAGFAHMGPLLAAFVMPNDPVIAKVLKETATLLTEYGHSSALDGYQSQEPARAYMLCAALWSAISAYKLTYAEPPASFEATGQKVRRPTTVIEQGLATCLDTSLLFAASLEAIGLNPVIILMNGHAFTGVWLTKKTFPNLVETDPSEVRKALVNRELILFETTGITHQPAKIFTEAVALGKQHLSEQEEANFIAAIDVARARTSQIRPMASHQPSSSYAADNHDEALALPLPQAPDFSILPAISTEEVPTTAAGRIDRWQRKLLDLSLRNRLLNFKDSKQSVPFICSDISHLEDRLADQKRIRIISLPDQNPLGDRDIKLHQQSTGKDINYEFAQGALLRDELSSPLQKNDLDTRLINIYRRAQNDMAEGGSNTLFLAVGFLRWKKSPEDSQVYRAPLLLVPVKLERRSASSNFNITHHEDDVRFNSTLLQLLKKDFDLNLTQFDADLPLDANGIDVPMVMQMMRQAIRDVQGFEVVDETALSNFSFAKYLMWKDLVERTDSLRQNRIVRHLIDNPDQSFVAGTSTAFPTEQDIDTKYTPQQLIAPLAADSSQLAAIIAAVEGQDFVLVGPPGTGKSQTIANMIAQCLAAQKSVLFVAEKTAALDVVYRRLKEHGLGNYCLEIHSSKTDRKNFINQLKSSWETSTFINQDQWININERLKIRRDELNLYVNELHAEKANGLSIFWAMGTSVRGQDKFSPELDWEKTIQHDRKTYDFLKSIIDDLAVTFKAITPVPALQYINVPEWSAGWEANFLAQTQSLAKTALAMKTALQVFSSQIGLGEKNDCSIKELSELTIMARSLQSVANDNYSVVFEEKFDALNHSISDIETAIIQFRTAEEKLSAAYDERDLDRIPIDELDRDWREANVTFWPKSMLGKRRIRKLLQSYVTSGTADPDRDLEQLRDMKSSAKSVHDRSLVGHVPEWNGLQTDTVKLRKHFEEASALRSSLKRLEDMAGSLQTIAQSVAPYLNDTASDHPVRDAAAIFSETSTKFAQDLEAYRSISGEIPFNKNGSEIISNIINALTEIVNQKSALQAWTAWCNVKQKAITHQISSFITAIEDKLLKPEELSSSFELAYVRWWLPNAIDSSTVLRKFQRFQHEEALRSFRQLDDSARAYAALEVQRKLARNLPKPNEVARRSELGLLRHQMELKRPSKSVREIISGMPDNFSKLAPCLLMSPLSIAQYLPASHTLFDVVIFDEASQITTWDAIGALARGKQAIIVGDPKQLPPTNFFGKSESEDADQEIQDFDKDLESILDEAKASGLPTLQLNWHYRSRHESLIAFSNHHYYNNRLVTFPSPLTDDRAVSLHYLGGNAYDRGKSRTNKPEAEAIANEAAKMMLDWLKQPEIDRFTLGIITFNSQQQSLIEDLLDQKRREHPEIEWFFESDRIEPTIVKNLENVQGDERDVMLFSITFGKDFAGKLTMTFGALNLDGGERRLNVAVTRARQKLTVFSSIRCDEIDLSRTKATGVKDLKTFLDYAERGAIALPAVQVGSVGSFDSPFEQGVAETLEDKGWTVVPQIGVSGYRVDLGIVHPDKPGVFLAGIECDGATYHSSATARDRDKIREQVLRGLGWEIIRIWSPDWWYDKNGAAQRVDEQLNQLLITDRKLEEEREAAAQAYLAEVAAQSDHALDQCDLIQNTENNNKDEFEQSGIPLGRPNFENSVPAQNSNFINSDIFKRADMADFIVSADAFFEDSYGPTIDNMIARIIETEGPIRDDIMMQRVARAHNWARTGAKIRTKILQYVSKYDTTIDSAGTFYWVKGSVQPVIPFRASESDDDTRSVAEIALPEIIGFIQSNLHALKDKDPALAIARLLGNERLASSSRKRIEEAISHCSQHL